MQFSNFKFLTLFILEFSFMHISFVNLNLLLSSFPHFVQYFSIYLMGFPIYIGIRLKLSCMSPIYHAGSLSYPFLLKLLLNKWNAKRCSLEWKPHIAPNRPPLCILRKSKHMDASREILTFHNLTTHNDRNISNIIPILTVTLSGQSSYDLLESI